MTKQQYRTERAGILAKVAEAREEFHQAKGARAGAFLIAQFWGLRMLAALRAEYYRGEKGAIRTVQAEALADMQAYLKRNAAEYVAAC